MVIMDSAGHYSPMYVNTPAQTIESTVFSVPLVLSQSNTGMSFLGKISGVKVVISTDIFASGLYHIHLSLVK